MNLTYSTFPDLPLTYPIFSGTWAFQISDSHLKNKKKMTCLYVCKGLAMWVFWIFDLPRPTSPRDLKSERLAYKDLLLYCEAQHLFFLCIFWSLTSSKKNLFHGQSGGETSNRWKLLSRLSGELSQLVKNLI
jgi:hypothetical protein